MDFSLTDRVSTGIAGLDEITQGGLLPQRAYLLRGGPGSGKTTLCLHFLAADADSRSVFVTLDEDATRVRWQAEKQGFATEAIEFEDLSSVNADTYEVAGDIYDLVSASDIELRPIIERLHEVIQTHQPKRVVIDSVSQLRYLSPDMYQFRRQIRTLFNFITSQGATVIFTAESGAEAPDDDLQFLSDGIIQLDRMLESRAISMTKFRGSGFADGVHFMRLGPTGMSVFPRLIPGDHSQPFNRETISTGVERLDHLFHGGLERGTVTIISGPTGVGKTTLGMQIIRAAAGRGERSVAYSFEEQPGTLIDRCRQINLPIDEMLDAGSMHIRTVEPVRYAPDELAREVRDEVEERGVKVVMLDSIAGYRLSVERLSVAGDDVVDRLHALCRYLVSMGVTVLIINEVSAISSSTVQVTEHGISYLSDAIILLRYLEIRGEVQKSIGILKKRTGDFEKTLSRFDITAQGLKVGEPLTELHGILSGQPRFDGETERDPTASDHTTER